MGETAEDMSQHVDSSEVGEDDKVKKSGRFASLKKWQKILTIIGIAIVALIVVVVVAIVIMINAGKADLLTPNVEDESYKTIEVDGQKYQYNDAIVNVCVIGTDRIYGTDRFIDDASSVTSGGSADAVMLMAYDTTSGGITLINCPRNLRVQMTRVYEDEDFAEPIVITDDDLFLASAYAFGDDDASSSEDVCEVLTTLFDGIPINNYVTMLESAIGPLSEAIGGVKVVSPVTDRTLPVQEGVEYDLSGDAALKFVQYRDTHVMTSPADRMKRQHAFATAFMDQAVEAIKKDPAILSEFYRILTDPDYMTTNLDLPDLSYLAYAAVTNGVDDVNLVTIPYYELFDPEVGINDYRVEEDEFQQMLLDIYYKPVEG